ncbi:MAG: hypothetical protein ACR2LA_08435, partial [Acidimicrobiales bacterium]
MGVPLLPMSAVGMVAGIPVAQWLADGNDTVQTYLTIRFLLLPIGIGGTLLVQLMAGLGALESRDRHACRAHRGAVRRGSSSCTCLAKCNRSRGAGQGGSGVGIG